MTKTPFQLNRSSRTSSSPTASFALQSITLALRYLAREAVHTAREVVYPPVCVHCQRVGEALCASCQADIVGAVRPFKSLYIEDFTAIGQHVGALRSAIHGLKYENQVRLSHILGKLLATTILAHHWTFDMVVPVPLHPDRQKERGYNQAEKIAQVLGAHLVCSVNAEALQRTRATSPQVNLSAQERRQNVSQAFIARMSLDGDRVLLIDDVCTTGATLDACAQALQAAGASAVLAATVSRAGPTVEIPIRSEEKEFIHGD